MIKYKLINNTQYNRVYKSHNIVYAKETSKIRCTMSTTHLMCGLPFSSLMNFGLTWIKELVFIRLARILSLVQIYLKSKIIFFSNKKYLIASIAIGLSP